MRVNHSEVSCLLPEGHSLKPAQINVAISAATCVIDDVSTYGAYTDACLIEMEKNLAAHFCAGTDNSINIASEKSACGFQATYGFKMGEGVKGSPFGNTANILSRGVLAELDKQPAFIQSIGSL